MRTVLASLLVMAAVAGAEAQAPTPAEQRFRDIYRELVEINTTDSVSRAGN